MIILRAFLHVKGIYDIYVTGDGRRVLQWPQGFWEMGK